MNSAIFFDFKVDKEKKKITIKREFAAELQLVWMHGQNLNCLISGGHQNHIAR